MQHRLVFLFLFLFQISYSQTLPFTSSNLPIVIIDTNNQPILDDPKIGADMGIIDNDVDVRNNVSDPFNDYDGRIGIEIRGSSSQMFPKKQYGVELWDENNDGIDASLLGFPEEEDWILFAPYNDKSLMRDVLAYKLGRDLGRYAARTKYCEVVLNGQYDGVYVLIEKIKRDKDRVDINKLNPDEISGNNLTGGYIIKIDKTTGSGGDGWFSTYPPSNNQNGQKVFFQYEDPKAEDIVSEQQQYIQQFMASFENTLAGDNYKNPVDGYAKYIDVDSFIDYFIINEVTKNVDAYRLSTFLHKQRDSDGGKLVMGPIWDYNLGFGNADYCTQGNPEGFAKAFNTYCPQDSWLIPFWWDRLFSDETFQGKLEARWNELREGPLATDEILSYIDSVALVLNESQQRNFQRWPVLGEYVWPNYYVGNTFQQEVDWLKNWIDQRLDWLDIHIQSVVTGVDDEIKESHFKAFPNPFADAIELQYTLVKSTKISIQIFDTMGRLLTKVERSDEAPGEHTLQIHTQSFSSGFYYYRFVKDGAKAVEGKLVKQ